jgi:YD repeat-containing protein
VEYGFAGPTVVRYTQGGDTTTARLTTRLWYNGQYQVIKRQDPAGLVWEWSYDAQGNLLWSKKPNGARTDYAYYAGTDRVWKITDALGYVWEYAYTSYGDVKSVKDPEGGVVQYVYDYELGEPAYGQVRRVIDALGRATEYWYYGADDANLARRGQVRRVEAPGGYWREMDYGGAGWLVRREVQTANGSEVTVYTYDAWGRLRGIDYPRSADVRMGWDGENRRVWVRDGVGERRYTYDAWGRVVRQQGCCGSEIDIVAVEASYDAAGRRTEIREMARWWDGSEVAWRTIYTFYDGLGRVKAIGPSPYPPGSEGGASNVIYHYDSAGRLWKEVFPNGNHFIHTYYGAEAPKQQGQLKSIQLCLGDCTAVDELGNPEGDPVFGYEYQYDLLGRVVESRELPSGDKTVYDYSPAGRLIYEGRDGDVSYMRIYSYHLDGSRQWVWRADGVRGEHYDWYYYDPVSGRLTDVVDELTGVAHRFVWNPEGTLARWSDASALYDRVYSYDEEGRLVRIGWDYRDGRERSRYEYRYNSDGFKVWEREWFETERGWRAFAYRFVCSIGCGALPLVIYREDGADDLPRWSRYQWTTDLLRGFWYEGYEFEPSDSPTWRNLDYELLAGYLWVADLWLDYYPGGGFRMRYWDRYGLVVGERFYPAKPKELFFGRRENRDVPTEYVPTPSVPPIDKNPRIPNPWFPKKPKLVGPMIEFCNGALRGNDVYEARFRCLEWFQTPEGSQWLERCMEDISGCGQSGNPEGCCLWKCMDEAGAGTGEAAKAVECFLKGYRGIWPL